MNTRIEATRDADLDERRIEGLRALFDGEYFAEFGRWERERPYGYAPAEMRILALDDGVIVGHVGIQPRRITVGGEPVDVGGTGGVLIAPSHRGRGVGNRLMEGAREAMRGALRVEFGYLGCREAVVPFYEATGWRRIAATERCVSHLDGTTVVTGTGPLLIASDRVRDSTGQRVAGARHRPARPALVTALGAWRGVSAQATRQEAEAPSTVVQAAVSTV